MTRITRQLRSSRRSWTALALAALLSLLSGPALAQGTNNPNYRAKAAQWHSKSLPALFTPKKKGQDVARRYIHDPQTMKLLVIAVDGNEPSYSAILAFLDQIGISLSIAIHVSSLHRKHRYPYQIAMRFDPFSSKNCKNILTTRYDTFERKCFSGVSHTTM